MSRRVALSVVIVLGALAVPAGAAVPASGEGGAPFLDVRDGARAEAVAERRTAPDAPAGQEHAADALVTDQGPQATLELDPTTGTVRSLADLSGALTGPSGADPRDIALAYVRAHRVALGLSDADLDTLRPAGQDVSPEGLTVVRWRQQTDGIAVFDNGLVVTLDHAGRVLSVGGAPLHEPDPNTAAPDVSSGQALAELRNSVGDGTGTQTAAPERTYFDVNGALRLAWHLQYRASPTALYDAVVDASSGRVLYRANLVKFAVNVNVFPHYPGAQFGGTQQSVDLSPYLSSTTSLSGPNAFAYADLNDNDSANTGEGVNPSTATSTFNTTYSLQSHGHCVSTAPCSWDHTIANSWSTNKAQDAIQAFWFVNVFHDHLATAPIGFTPDSGAFEDDDRLIVNTDDGANGPNGVPDSDHRNNANMSTPSDGHSPRMQMYLFGKSTGFRDVNGGDAAEIVFHEYTHGLSSRLVVSGSGNEALDDAEAGAMGEAWSDWYAMDFLNRGDARPSGMGAVLVPDTTAPGEVDLGAYTDAIPDNIRTQPLDCPVGADATACPGFGTAGSGGYTYGDFGKVCGCGPEVHSDGEIWAETLWDLRTALIAHFGGSVAQGSDAAEQLVTGGMRLSPPEPSFLDMRNAILLADANLGGVYKSIIWDVFAHRGMGFFAGALDSTDVTPAEDFSAPPAPGAPTSTLSGTITDAITGHPVPGLTVSVGGHTNGDSVYTATTNSAGQYSLPGLPDGTYGKVFVLAASGYDGAVRTNVTVSGPTTLDFALHRNWASAALGGAIASDTDAYAAPYDCGAAALIDGDEANGWSAYNPTSPDYPTPTAENHLVPGQPPTATIALSHPIDISAFGADPGTTCGDDSTATAKTFTIETSPDGSTWTTAYDGTTASTQFDASDAGTMKTLVPTDGATGVRYVRLTLLSPQSTSNGSGADFIDFSEFAVYGNAPPTAALSVPASATAGTTVALDASGSSDDGTLVSYGWDFDGDGTTDQTTTGPVVQHVYANAGTFTPSVTVTDDGGSTARATGGSIAVAAAPVQPPPPVQTPPASTPPKPALALLAGHRTNGVSVRILCPLACTGSATLRLTARAARRAKLHVRTIARISIKASPGVHTIRIAVKRSVLRALRKHHVRSLRPALAVRLVDTRSRLAQLVAAPLVRISRR